MTSLVAQMAKHLPTIQETRVQSLGWEDLLEKEMATHSSILAWKIPQTEKPGSLQSMGSQRVGHDWATSLSVYLCISGSSFIHIISADSDEFLLWQEYTEELYKKDLHDQDKHNGVITHPDILECEVKRALESITTNKASGDDGIPVISNPERWCCESATLNMPANLENSAATTGLENVSFHSNSKERQCQRILKLPHNCTHLTC